jgi:hypothetical protein
MSNLIRLRALGRAALAASVLLLGASVAAPAHAQMLNRPLIRPPSPTANAPLSPGQQMQSQSFANALNNRARELQGLGGGANANAALRTERQSNSLQLQQLQMH